jgi:hypothetical protein
MLRVVLLAYAWCHLKRTHVRRMWAHVTPFTPHVLKWELHLVISKLWVTHNC